MGDAGGWVETAAARPPAVLLELDGEGRAVRVGPSAADHLHGPPEPGTGPTALLMLVHPDDRDRAYAVARTLGAAPAGVAAITTLRVRSPDGSWHEVSLHARRHGGGAVVTILAADGGAEAPVATAVLAPDGRFDRADARLTELLGYDEAELRRRWPAALTHPADRARSAALDRLIAAGADHAEASLRWLRAEGTVLVITERRSAPDEDGRVAVHIDASTAQAPPPTGSPEDDLAGALADAAPTMLLAVDPGGTVVRANPAAGVATGRPPADLVGVDVDDAFPSTAGDRPLHDLVRRALERRSPVSTEIRVRGRGAAVAVLDWTASPLEPPVGRAAAVLAAVDVTERQAALAAVSFQALHDPLTRLPNRALLHERLAHAISRLGRTEDELAVLFIDLNHFKEVNDRFGHEAGDRLLAALAERFRSAVRPSDTVARIGGDEFVVLCEDLSEGASALAIVDRLVDAVEQPFRVDDTEVTVSAAVGIAFARHAGTDAEALIRQADAAMYDAKRRSATAPRSRAISVGEPAPAPEARPLLDAADLRAAVHSGGLIVLYQPQIALPGGELTGVEALVRIVHPERGLLTPASFLAVAEDSGLMGVIGAHVIGDVCRRAAQWRRVAPDLRVTVNLSATELADAGTATALADALTENNLDPDAIVVDVREDVLLAGEAAALDALRSLKRVGVQLCIDDAGLRFTTSGDLVDLGIDEVKVAGGHVRALGEPSSGEPVVASIVRLARTLDLRTVAEGVETVEQLAGLQALGCHAGQGYLFAPPQPPDVIDRLVGPGLRWPTDVPQEPGEAPT